MFIVDQVGNDKENAISDMSFPVGI